MNAAIKITVMHVEHGIRGHEALDDAEFVKSFSAQSAGWHLYAGM